MLSESQVLLCEMQGRNSVKIQLKQHRRSYHVSTVLHHIDYDTSIKTTIMIMEKYSLLNDISFLVKDATLYAVF